MDKLKYVKLENNDGSYSSSIPLAVDSDYVDVNGNTLTTEINSKATKNQLNTSISDLQNELDNNIDILHSELNDKSLLLQKQINGLASGSPLSASSIGGMTDTSKIYVNTTDGHWYYYDGNSWEDGGVYQATQLENNSVDILVLDEKLQDNFTMSFGDFESLGNGTDGYPFNHDGVIDITSTTSYQYFVINLTKGNIYNFTVYNKTYVTGLFITDSSDNVIYSSNTTHPSDWVLSNLIIKIKSAGLKAYLTKSKTTFTTSIGLSQSPTYRIFDKITNTLSLDLIPRELISYSDVHMAYDASTGKLKASSDSNSSVRVYSLDKGKKYKFKTFSGNVIRGLMITNDSYELQYIVPYFETLTKNIDYIYTATQSGFAFLTDYRTNYNTIEVINETIENLKEEMVVQKVGFTNWYIIGDSITAENEWTAKHYFDYIIEDIPSINGINLGVSGSGYKNPTSGATPNTFIDRISRISSYNLGTDIITVMGSINDIRYVQDNLGQLGDTTTDTIYGCLYTFFNTLFTNFNGVRVGCISPITAKEYLTNKVKWESYFTALKETCELFNVPFLDILHTGNLRPNNTDFLNEYYAADGPGGEGEIGTAGVHPNSKGHRLFYQRIKEFVKTL